MKLLLINGLARESFICSNYVMYITINYFTMFGLIKNKEIQFLQYNTDLLKNTKPTLLTT